MNSTTGELPYEPLVDNVSLEIDEGGCFGLLGPNGAGKTSLIRMITAYLIKLGKNRESWGIAINRAT
jgi:ABC-type multidrug transport system ATPase subunit